MERVQIEVVGSAKQIKDDVRKLIDSDEQSAGMSQLLVDESKLSEEIVLIEVGAFLL